MPIFIAQLTDLHLLAGGREAEPNRARFLSCIETLDALIDPPDLCLVTGDIAERGEEGAYRFFLRTMAALGRPWLCLLGNHDDPARFAAVAASEPADAQRHVGSVRLGAWRIVAVDTAKVGMDGGYFDDERGDRLAAVLAIDPVAPTIIAMHHPPAPSGVGWIDAERDAAWVRRFGAVIAGFPQVRQILCGHAHMAVATHFRGIPTCIAPATAAQLWPEFALFDAERPDGRPMVVDGQPGFALHRLVGDAVATTFAAPPAGLCRLRHGEAAQGLRSGNGV